MSHASLINTFFSGTDQSKLGDRIEFALKETIFKKYPEQRYNEEYNVLLSYCIHGAHHAYLSNQHIPPERLIYIIENIVKTLQPLHEPPNATK